MAGCTVASAQRTFFQDTCWELGLGGACFSAEASSPCSAPLTTPLLQFLSSGAVFSAGPPPAHWDVLGQGV